MVISVIWEQNISGTEDSLHSFSIVFDTPGADLGGGGPEGAAAPPFSSSEIYFLSKYTIIL